MSRRFVLRYSILIVIIKYLFQLPLFCICYNPETEQTSYNSTC